MIIVGCDFHPSWQQVMIFDSDTGEISERKLAGGPPLRFLQRWGPGMFDGHRPPPFCIAKFFLCPHASSATTVRAICISSPAVAIIGNRG